MFKTVVYCYKSGVLKGSAAILITAGVIFSSPIAFFGLSCWSRFRTPSLLTGKNIVLSLMSPLVVILLFSFNMLGWFLDDLLILRVEVNFASAISKNNLEI